MADTALLVMDIQQGVVDRVATGAGPLLAALGRATDGARSAGVPVVYVRVAFRRRTPEVSPRNRAFAAIAGSGSFGDDDPATQIHPDVAPQPHDVVVVKKRVSAFTGSDLDVVLRSLGVHSLVLTGIATSGVVLSTLRQAADLDYELTVLADADPEVHRVLVEKAFPRQANVTTTDDWLGQLGR